MDTILRTLFPKKNYGGIGTLPRAAKWGIIGVCLVLIFFSVGVEPFYATLFGILGYLFVLACIQPIIGFAFTMLFLPVANIQYIIQSPSSQAGMSIPILIRVIHIIIIPCFVAWMFRQLARSGKPYQKTGFEVPSLCLLVMASITLIWMHYEYSYYQIYRIMTGFLLFLLTVGIIRTKKILNFTLGFWVFMGVFASGMAFLSKYYGQQQMNIWSDTGYTINLVLFTAITTPKESGGLKASGSNRAGGFDAHDDVSAFLNLYIMITLGLLLSTKNKILRVVLAICMLTMLVAQMMTYSRGGICGMVLGFFFLAMRMPQFRKRALEISLYSITGLIILFLIVYAKKLDFALKRIEAIFSNSMANSGTSSRILAWVDGWKIFYKSPILGGGIGAERCLYGDVHAHNIYLSVLYEMGLVGFGFFCWQIKVIVKNIRMGIAKIKDPFYANLTWCFAGGLVAYAFQGIIDFETTWHFLWQYIGIGFCIIQLGIKESEEPAVQRAV